MQPNSTTTNSLHEKAQSDFHPGRSSEAALVRVTKDLLRSADSGSRPLLFPLDVTAALDTVDTTSCHIASTPPSHLAWFSAHLTNRSSLPGWSHSPRHLWSPSGISTWPRPLYTCSPSALSSASMECLSTAMLMTPRFT